MTNGSSPAPLSSTGRFVILAIAFLGWFFGGVHMSITQLTGQAAAIDLLDQSGELDRAQYQIVNKQFQTKKDLTESDKARLDLWKPRVAQWFAWFQCSFLFGAATGGLLFGWLGDRFGRSTAMAASIITYSLFAAAASQANSPLLLCALWFLACTGVGGVWPNGVALLAEAWSGLSRPAVAGVIGTAANIGIFGFATLAASITIDANHWRWAMLVGAAPLVLGVAAMFIVPESPRWLAAQLPPAPSTAIAAGEPPLAASVANASGSSGVFRPPLLGITLIAIVLATVPIIGGWGTANWMIPWAEEIAGPTRKAEVQQARAFTGLISSLLGGWIAAFFGRRTTYFCVSVASLALAQYIFAFCSPDDASFLFWIAALGFVSGIYFGWLPLCLPELFPTRVRSTGAGVGFNFGRIVTAVTIFASGALSELFKGDYARIGQLTSLLFVLGIAGIWLAPDTSKKQLDD